MSEKDEEYTVDYFEYKANEFNKKYIEELDRVLAIYKRAFELACEELENAFGHYEPFYKNYFLQQVKKELEEQDVKNS